MKVLTKDMKIFSYKAVPVTGWEGDDGGFSIELYGNGNLRYCMYKLFDDIQLLQMFKVERETVYDIYEIIETSGRELEQIPDRLDNGSEDGMTNEFQFFEYERITALNIRESFIQGTMLIKHNYYKQYKDNMVYENIVLKVFKDICKVLKAADVELTLEKCIISRDCKLKVTW